MNGYDFRLQRYTEDYSRYMKLVSQESCGPRKKAYDAYNELIEACQIMSRRYAEIRENALIYQAVNNKMNDIENEILDVIWNTPDPAIFPVRILNPIQKNSQPERNCKNEP